MVCFYQTYSWIFCLTIHKDLTAWSALPHSCNWQSRSRRTMRKKEYSVDLTPGQFAISEGELAILWKCNRKTASKIVDMFHEVGLVSSVPNCRTSVFTVHCVASWYIVIRQSEIRITHVIIRLNNASRLTTKAQMLLLTMIPMMSIVSVLYPFL